MVSTSRSFDDSKVWTSLSFFSRQLKKKDDFVSKIESCYLFCQDINLSYFFICREKEDSEVHNLESSEDLEVDTIDCLEKENDELRDKLSKLKSH